ncbi:MAG: phosphotransferase, partial [Promethearchaeota archaeon]
MNNTSAAEQVRKKQRIKHLLAVIVENLKEYFDELQVTKFGQKSRFIVLNDISTIHKVGSKGLQLVTATFNSEQGSLTLKIAIKSFDSPDEALRNKMLTNRLATKLKDTGVLTPRVIFDYESILIYEGIQGETFYDSTINDKVKLQLTGEALSKFHSTKLRPLDKERYVFILKKVFQELILPEERKRKLIDLASNSFAKILGSSSGTAGFGDFHPGNVLFSEETDDDGNERIQTWLIDPEYVEEEQSADRMEDV